MIGGDGFMRIAQKVWISELDRLRAQQ